MTVTRTNIKRHLLYFLVSMGIYVALLVPFKQIQLLEGFADFRISAIFPVMAGLLMGPAGAVGCGVGNLIADVFGTLNAASLFGLVGNFLFAFLPYKLWHTLIPLNRHKLCYLYSADSLLKYLLITAFSVVTSMSVIGASGEFLGLFTYNSFLRTTVLCNICFSVFGGTIFFLLLTEYFGIRPYVPQKVYQYAYDHKKYTADYFLCAVILLLELATYLLSSYIGQDRTALHVLCGVMLAAIAALAVLPLRRSKRRISSAPARYVPQRGLQSQLLIGFLSFSFIEILVYSMAMYFLISGNYPHGADSGYFSDMWLLIFEHSFVGGVVFLLALYIVLRWTERHVTAPIKEIAGYAERFVAEKLESEKPRLPKLNNEIQTLGESVSKMTDDIIQYVKTIQEQAKKEERNKAILSVAHEIQMGILPDPWKKETPWQAEAYIHTAQEVGGDFYDFFQVTDDRFLVCVADVSGKGISAAMFMAEASMLVKTFRELPPNQMLAAINNILCDNNSAQMFVTMFIGVLDTKKKAFAFSNAGHNYPMISDGKRDRWLKSEPELFLGMIPGMDYTLHRVPASGPFELFLYTDGVNEAENESGEFFGNERLEQRYSEIDKRLPLAEQMELFKNELRRFTGNASQSDDITMLLLQYQE